MDIKCGHGISEVNKNKIVIQAVRNAKVHNEIIKNVFINIYLSRIT